MFFTSGAAFCYIYILPLAMKFLLGFGVTGLHILQPGDGLDAFDGLFGQPHQHFGVVANQLESHPVGAAVHAPALVVLLHAEAHAGNFGQLLPQPAPALAHRN